MSQELSFGGWLKQRRDQLGVTRDELAERVGFSSVLLRKLESGDRRPSGQIALLLADYFRIPSDERDAFVAFARTGRSESTSGAAAYSGSDTPQSLAAPWRRAYSNSTNLPAVLTPLLGREQEVAAVLHQIKDPKARLLTLTGAPGIGKTRLAVQIASELVEHFEDGVFFVDLAPIVDPGLVLSTIARALGLKEAAEQSIEAILFDYARDKRCLVVLDNFEQVLDAAHGIARLLEAGSWLKALVTSREALHVRGERRLPVPPLDLPRLEHHPNPEELVRYASVELFVERSRMQVPDFTLTAQNAGAVARICVALDGLPLAIELAAAHSGFFSPQELEARLGSRLQMLKTRARDLPDRQRTLRGAIEWSYNLLTTPEQALFRRMGVFVGGCYTEAVTAVAGKDLSAMQSSDPYIVVWDLLEGLVGKNMVTRSANGWRQMTPWAQQDVRRPEHNDHRLGMLETLREYALEQLVASGEEADTRDRHARYYLMFEKSRGENASISDEAPWLEMVASEYNNVREALEWVLEEHKEVGKEKELERVLLGAQLCSDLFTFWHVKKNQIPEARAWYERAAQRIARLVTAEDHRAPDLTAITRAQALSPELPAWWVRMLIGAGAMAYYQGEYEDARLLTKSGLALSRMIGHKNLMRSSLNNLGMIATDQGDYPSARQFLVESLELARELNAWWGIIAALGNLGDVEISLGSLEEARSHLEEALSIARAERTLLGIAARLRSLGVVARLQGRYAEARSYLEEAMRIFPQLDSKVDTAGTVAALGAVARDEGNFVEARALYCDGLKALAESGNRMVIADCLEGLAAVAGELGQPERAARLFGAVERLREDASVPLAPSEVPIYLKHVAAAREQMNEEQWNAAWRGGRAMTSREAVVYALEEK